MELTAHEEAIIWIHRAAAKGEAVIMCSFGDGTKTCGGDIRDCTTEELLEDLSNNPGEYEDAVEYAEENGYDHTQQDELAAAYFGFLLDHDSAWPHVPDDYFITAGWEPGDDHPYNNPDQDYNERCKRCGATALDNMRYYAKGLLPDMSA